MLRTAWVVVRRTVRGVVSSDGDGQGVLGDVHGHDLACVDPAEGDLLRVGRAK